MDSQRSGIPRPVSRLPLPTASASRSIRPSPSRDRLQADRGLNISRLRRPSEDALRRSYLSQPSQSKLIDPTLEEAANSATWNGKENGTHADAFERSEPEVENSIAGQFKTPLRKAPSPSLSDRTVETISQIPPSPSPARRKSSFFTSESPMRPPSRTSVATSYSRPSSRQENGYGSYSNSSVRSLPTTRPSKISTMPRPSTTRKSIGNLKEPARKPSLRPLGLESGQGNINGQNISLSSSSSKLGDARNGASKTMPLRASKPRPSINSIFTEPAPPQTNGSRSPKSLSVRKTRKPSSTVSSDITSPTSTISKKSARTSITSDGNPSELPTKEVEARKASKSSNALRESIAKAKAAKKAGRESTNNNNTGFLDSFETGDNSDPFGGQLPAMELGKGALRSRTNAARRSGHLNIAAMGLKELPDEVLTMYDFDPESNGDWYENVELAKFIAADNELESLPETFFPDVDMETLVAEENSRGSMFWGLELLDLHGNLLTGLPAGLKKLQRLRNLNLSNNKLDMDAIETIAQLEHLTDLKLASNGFQGTLSQSICSLHRLETLDLHGNSLTDLPSGLSNLTALRVLNVSENNLESLPFNTFCGLPLMDLNAQKNKLKGSLFPASFTRMDTLQVLDVSANALESLCATESDVLELPSLQELSMDANQIRKMPNVSSWKALLRLTAEDNDLSEFPEGLAELENVKVINVAGNSIRTLDEKIGFMESLMSLRISNNPLRERKFLSMDTDEIKRELQSRCEADVPEGEGENSSVQTEFTLAPESPTAVNAWQVKRGGVLDRSSTELASIEPQDLEPIISSNTNIRCLYLQRNRIQCLPVPALSLVAHTLTDLDLSNNPLNKDGLLDSPLSLPHLQNLVLSATGISSLEPLQTHLSAPCLTFLDVSNNNLSGPLPPMRHTYPSLITLLACDNQIDSLDFDAVEGLQVLDVSNNNIASLPSKLGLLSPESHWNGGQGLRRLDVAGNCFRVPRWQVVAKGTEAVLEWLRNRITEDEKREWGVEEDP